MFGLKSLYRVSMIYLGGIHLIYYWYTPFKSNSLKCFKKAKETQFQSFEAKLWFKIQSSVSMKHSEVRFVWFTLFRLRTKTKWTHYFVYFTQKKLKTRYCDVWTYSLSYRHMNHKQTAHWIYLQPALCSSSKSWWWKITFKLEIAETSLQQQYQC